MRINARLDDDAQAQIDYLTQATGQSVSHVVREAVARYYAQTRAQQAGPRRLLAMIGQGDSGRSDVASRVKQEVSAELVAKHGLSR
jgi:predicted transcriptional regulator